MEEHTQKIIDKKLRKLHDVMIHFCNGHGNRMAQSECLDHMGAVKDWIRWNNKGCLSSWCLIEGNKYYKKYKERPW